MLATARFKQLEEFIKASSKEELIWVNGYLSGLIGGVPDTTEKIPVVSAAKRITITYGTETGNAQKLATAFAARAKKKGIPAKLVGLDQYKPGDLDKEEYFFTVISTQGDGEPPIAAQKFYDYIHSNGFKIPELHYGVLALGDTAYPLFCKTGEDVDRQLEKLGARRFVPMQKCDLDFEVDAERWMDEVLSRLQVPVVPADKLTAQPEPAQKAGEKKWFSGTVLENINLTATGSTKRTYHIALSVPGIAYQAGDSVAIVPENAPAEVSAILESVGLLADTEVIWKKESYLLHTLLLRKANIRFLTERIVQEYATITGHTIPAQRKDLLYLLGHYPVKDKAQFEEVVQLLNPIAPRIYNIASSPAAHPDEIHIIVAQDLFTEQDTTGKGLCTAYLESLQPGAALPFFIQVNRRFRLPASDKNVIMIGPGTGIAPFRSFLAERDINGDAGANWLFFGETDFTTDFYYQVEWQTWFNTGTLTRISLAFEKNNNGFTSVTDKLAEQSAALFEWIKGGAYLYLCGEKDPMSRSVEEILLKIFMAEGNLNEEHAKAFFEQLKKEGRYIKDVY